MMKVRTVAVNFALLFISTLVTAYSDEAAKEKLVNYSLEKTVFVIEVTGTGAADPQSKAKESSRIGARRIKEYLHEQKLLSYKYNPNSILSLAPALSKRASDAELVV